MPCAATGALKKAGGPIPFIGHYIVGNVGGLEEGFVVDRGRRFGRTQRLVIAFTRCAMSLASCTSSGESPLASS